MQLISLILLVTTLTSLETSTMDLSFRERLAALEQRFKKFSAVGTEDVLVSGNLRTGLAVNLPDEQDVVPSAPLNILYIQFKLNTHIQSGSPPGFIIGNTGLTNYVEVLRSEGATSGHYIITYVGPTGFHLLTSTDGSWNSNTWYTYDFKFDFSVSPAVATFRLDGSVIGSFLLDKGGLTIEVFR